MDGESKSTELIWFCVLRAKEEGTWERRMDFGMAFSRLMAFGCVATSAWLKLPKPLKLSIKRFAHWA